MIGTFDYQERISECAHWSETAANDQAKMLWKEMEQFWRQRAIAHSCDLTPRPACPSRIFL